MPAKYLRSAEEVASEVARLASRAASTGTFGVGAILVANKTGEVLDHAANAVVGNPGGDRKMTRDPTAHGEMQLIRRYFEARNAGRDLPDPGNLTIVTSTEPCAMCSGAVMVSGFNVGIVSLDPEAGIGGCGTQRFRQLPPNIAESVAARFGYYAVAGLRTFLGSTEVIFGEESRTKPISRSVHDACEKTFQESLAPAMRTVNESRGDGEGQAAGDPNLYPDVREKPDNRPGSIPARESVDLAKPDDEVITLLRTMFHGSPGSSGAWALLDAPGNLIAASAGSEPEDPTCTGLVKIVRDYSELRFRLASRLEKGHDLSNERLHHPKFGVFLRYPEPDFKSPLAIMELGVYGSTMEGPVPAENEPNLCFIRNGRDARLSRIRRLIEGMPPLYSEAIGIQIEVFPASP